MHFQKWPMICLLITIQLLAFSNHHSYGVEAESVGSESTLGASPSSKDSGLSADLKMDGLSEEDNEECVKGCQETIGQVCASNGIIYVSLCEMKRKTCGHNVTVMEMKYCSENGTKIHRKSSSEAAQSNSTPNDPSLNYPADGLEPLAIDPHPKDGECPKICLHIHDPVCASNGLIYPNECVARKVNCGKKIELVDRSFCFRKNRQARKLGGCPQYCLNFYKPVCGSDGQIYMNECYLEKFTCGKKVQAVEMRKCIENGLCPGDCIALPDPVCASDGQIYLNMCRMYKESCLTGAKLNVMPLSFCVGSENVGKLH